MSSTAPTTLTTNTTLMPETVSHVNNGAASDPIFLQTTLAKGIAGTFVLAALFLTCQQVIYFLNCLLNVC